MKNKNLNSRTVCRNLRIERREICFFKYLFEAYEGIAVLETIDAKKGHISLHTAPGCEAVVEDILSDLSKKYRIEDI
ncbi:MAG: DUF4911 domain-containing protein [Desulfosalsimonas sp.]